MTVRAVTKQKHKQRPVTCTACAGEMMPIVVTVYNRFGEPSEGIQVVHVPCEACNSSGKTRRRLEPACCCSGAADARCTGCANARRGGSEIHVCERKTQDELAFEQELAFAPSPATVRSDKGRNSTAADMGVGERSGQRGNR